MKGSVVWSHLLIITHWVFVGVWRPLCAAIWLQQGQWCQAEHDFQDCWHSAGFLCCARWCISAHLLEQSAIIGRFAVFNWKLPTVVIFTWGNNLLMLKKVLSDSLGLIYHSSYVCFVLVFNSCGFFFCMCGSSHLILFHVDDSIITLYASSLG